MSELSSSELETVHIFFEEITGKNNIIGKQPTILKLNRKYQIIDVASLKPNDDVLNLLINKPTNFIKELSRLIDDMLGSYMIDSEQNTEIHFKNLTTNHKKIKEAYHPKNVGKLIQTEGIIKSMTFNDSRATSATFKCKQCGEEIEKAQDSFRLTPPIACRACGKNEFKPIDVIRIPYTLIELEELPENDDDQNSIVLMFVQGNALKIMEENQSGLGCRVKVTAWVEYMPKWAQPPQEQAKSQQKVALIGNYIELLDDELISTTISSEEEAQIKELAKNPQVYNILTESIAPNLLGLTDLKEGILYALFGGVRRTGKVLSRGMIHILMVSDPGQGKSVLMDYIKKVAPKCRKAVGGQASKCGIGAGAVKSEITGMMSIQAGLLVLAHKGILILDEFDKMASDDRSVLHESSESGTFTKSVTGQNRTFNAETTIIAACNPKHGRFDPYEPLVKQINIIPSLLSRFDLVFVLRDVPNLEQDSAIADKIFDNYASPDLSATPIVAPLLLKKYIMVAKKINPCFPDDPTTKKIFTQFYTAMRGTGNEQDKNLTIAITTRQAESVLRLAEASARIRLSTEVNDDDLNRAINIINKYLKKFALDEKTGKIDIDRIGGETTASERGNARIFMGVVDELAPHYLGGEIPINDLISKMRERCTISESECEDLIDRIKREGSIFCPRPDKVKKL